MLSQTRLSYALGVVLLLLGTLLAGNADDRLGAVDAGARAAGVGARGAGQIRVRAEGCGPRVRLYNTPELRSVGDIDAYVAARKAALRRLARKQPDREIEVSISPRDYADFATLWDLKEAHGLQVATMTVNFFRKGSGEYAAAMGVGERDPRKSSFDFNRPAAGVEAQVRALLPPSPPGGTRIAPSGEVDVRVTWLRGTLRADRAVRLDAEAAIMLVDPIADLVDAHGGPAAGVEMIDMPHLLDKKKELEGDRSLR